MAPAEGMYAHEKGEAPGPWHGHHKHHEHEEGMYAHEMGEASGPMHGHHDHEEHHKHHMHAPAPGPEEARRHHDGMPKMNMAASG